MKHPLICLLALVVGNAVDAALVIEAERAAIRTYGNWIGKSWNIWGGGRIGQFIRVNAGGQYKIAVRALGRPAANVWPEMAIEVNGEQLKTVTVASAEAREYVFEVPLVAGLHEITVTFLNDAVIGGEDRNLCVEQISVSGPTEPLLADEREWAEEAERRETEIVAATRAAIEKHRKSDATVRLLDARGRPLRNVRVVVRQLGHEFLFGCNIYGFNSGETYRQRFAELFNYATVGFYWRWYEPERGKPKYAETDRIVEWCQAHGIRMKGHPLLWAEQAGIPPWSQGQPPPEIQRQRVRDIMERYRDKIEFWEVVNEPAHLPSLPIDEPYRWAREVNPRAYLIVNDYHVLANGFPPFYQLLAEAIRNGVPFDGIGIQAHEPRTMRFPLDRVQRILNRYATLGKELHITEFTPTSGGEPITGSHRKGVWDETAQADYAVKFYRVCFAHPAIRAITWWDLSDKGSWLKGGGLLRADMSPKPAYEQLRSLIREEWMTRLEGKTDRNGRFMFRGFRGRYELIVNGQTCTFALSKDTPQPITLRLAK
ncbi:MAG: endo-1,4-beta-xylanase [Verrucomicrobiae bacterium]|nr:endo-1,4-beta-xylanase [Verrucomicrobiae bacterium]